MCDSSAPALVVAAAVSAKNVKLLTKILIHRAAVFARQAHANVKAARAAPAA